MLGQLVVVTLGGIVGFEALKFWKAKTQSLALMQGHNYAISLNYSKDPASPVTQETAQAALDAAAPGAFAVMSAAMTPGPTSGIRQMAIYAVRTGATGPVSASCFTSGWPAAYGSVTLGNVTDMGGVGGLPEENVVTGTLRNILG